MQPLKYAFCVRPRPLRFRFAIHPTYRLRRPTECDIQYGKFSARAEAGRWKPAKVSTGLLALRGPRNTHLPAILKLSWQLLQSGSMQSTVLGGEYCVSRACSQHRLPINSATFRSQCRCCGQFRSCAYGPVERTCRAMGHCSVGLQMLQSWSWLTYPKPSRRPEATDLSVP